MVLFGPSGNSEEFYAEGHTSTMETAEWLKTIGKDLFPGGLDLFEYSFGQGYRMKTEVAEAIGLKFKEQNIEMSVHAPYFINFANPDDVMFEKSVGYISTGIKFLNAFGAKRLVFHSGSCGKETRERAVSLIAERFRMVMPNFEEMLKRGEYLCPETMGKTMQIGTYKEVIDLCTISKILMPTFDFGHINALTQGSLKKEEDYERIFDYCEEKLGHERTDNAHIHFSKIEYGAKGEIRHLTFDDTIFGPEFKPLCNVLIKRNLNCHIICESAGTQSHDSAVMKSIYLKNRA